MLVYTIRHGQTDWNTESRLQGQKAIGLNALGRAQTTCNGETLAALVSAQSAAFDFVSSPLSRARETMERVRSAMGLPPHDYRIATTG